MRHHIKYLFLFQVLFLGSAYAAFDIRADVDSQRVSWRNVTYADGDMVPSMWATPPMLRSTSAWVPATFAAQPQQTLVLLGSGGSSAPIVIDIAGMEYNTVGITYTPLSSSMGGGCSRDKVQLPIISLKGESCISSTKLVNNVSVNPFVFYRPIFNISDTSITSALAGLPEGIYSGVAPINIRYYYDSNGILTYRNISEVLMVKVNYSPADISDVVVNGNGFMAPQYDTMSRRISADTQYDITVNGNFTNGIVLNMPNQTYELVNETDNSVTIPYQVVCSGCNVTNLVDSQGRLITPVSTVGANSGAITSLNFRLDLSYDVSGIELMSGRYSDDIVLIIEPGI
ncbi:MAG: hypothetical protein HWE19_17455 [Vibrionaceae bacterium]|nr:hypothetical protein [Vibrionaceae bacterium]